MKKIDYSRMRRALAVLVTATALGGIIGSASAQQPPMYRMSSSSAQGIGNGGGVPASAWMGTPLVTNGTCTLYWYGLQSWDTIQGATSPAGPWNNLTSVEASGYSWQTTLPDPDTTNGYSFFQLNQNNTFQGSQACGGCHGAQYVPFTYTVHASAYNILGAANQNSSHCLTCHTVGFGQPTGFTTNPLTANLEGVGCECCHGAAGWHKNSNHSSIIPALSLDPAICGSCHNGHNPQYNEYTNSPHYLVNDTINYNIENGVYYTNTVTIGNTTYYGYYVTTNANLTLKTNSTSGIFNSSYSGAGVDPGYGRQTSCGLCHSGAARMAMINDYAARQAGITNPLVLPLAADAGAWGPACGVCHDPHGLTASPVFTIVSNTIMQPVSPNYVQLRNPIWSSNFYTMASQSDERFDSMGNPYYMNTTVASMYNPNVNLCGQCHNTRGARWDGRAYGLITNSYQVTNYVISAVYSNSYTTNYLFGQIVGIETNPIATGAVVTNAVVTNLVSLATGLTTITNGFSRQPHLSPQYNMLIGILQPDYLNTTNGKTFYYTNVNNGLGIYATHSGMAPVHGGTTYNTNQCVTCHVPSYTSSSGTTVTGHTFAMDPNGCALGGCHTTGWPDYVDYQIQNTNFLSSVVDLLNRWSTNNAPAIFTNYNTYGLDSWEYSSPGSLGVQGGSGPTTADQLLLPNAIQQARFNIYMIYCDGSFGPHNPTFIPLLLRDAETKVLSQFALAKFNASSMTVSNLQKVTFTNLSVGATSCVWSFGDGTSTNTTATTVTHAYSTTTPGAFTVSLNATNSVTNETLTRNNFINVYFLPAASFSYSMGPLTTNNTVLVNFNNTSSNSSYSKWSLYDTTGTNLLLATAGLNISYTYTNANNGNFPVVMTASGPAGSVTITNKITVP